MTPKALPVGSGSTAVGFTALGDRYCVMSETGALRRRSLPLFSASTPLRPVTFQRTAVGIPCDPLYAAACRQLLPQQRRHLPKPVVAWPRRRHDTVGSEHWPYALWLVFARISTACGWTRRRDRRPRCGDGGTGHGPHPPSRASHRLLSQVRSPLPAPRGYVQRHARAGYGGCSSASGLGFGKPPLRKQAQGESKIGS
jgi:hypothetical protein